VTRITFMIPDEPSLLQLSPPSWRARFAWWLRSSSMSWVVCPLVPLLSWPASQSRLPRQALRLWRFRLHLTEDDLARETKLA